MSTNVLAVDIGNTSTCVGLVDTGKAACVRKTTFPSSEVLAQLAGAVQNVLSGVGQEEPVAAAIASVVSSGASDVCALLAGAPGVGRVRRVRYHERLPFTVAYREPHALGVDRLANCLYAGKMYGGQDCVIADAGTAVTVDLLSGGGVFRGGFILPGVEMQLEALHKGTDGLPLVTAGHGEIMPPASTSDGMRDGVRLGLGGAVTYLVWKLRNICGSGARVLTCGGAWDVLADHVSFDYTYVPDLTLLGVALFED